MKDIYVSGQASMRPLFHELATYTSTLYNVLLMDGLETTDTALLDAAAAASVGGKLVTGPTGPQAEGLLHWRAFADSQYDMLSGAAGLLVILTPVEKVNGTKSSKSSLTQAMAWDIGCAFAMRKPIAIATPNEMDPIAIHPRLIVVADVLIGGVENMKRFLSNV